jgi:hypothetical protein
MDAIQTVIDAVVTGASAVAKDAASDMVRGAYDRLKRLFVVASPGKQDDQATRIEIDDNSVKPRELRKHLETLDQETLLEAVARAKRLMDLLKPSISQSGYNLNVQGNVHSLVQGSRANVTIIQRSRSRGKKKASS